MNILTKYILLFIFFSGMFACTGEKSLKEYNVSGQAQGTTYAIKFYATDSSVFTKADVELILDSLNHSLSLYMPGSVINQFNASETGIEMDSMISTVVHRAMEITDDTKGLSDITVFPLVQFWGFGVKGIKSEPDTSKLPEIMQCVGHDLIYLKDQMLMKKKPCVKIDLNGIAQGYSVDRIAENIERRGIVNYIVEVGGEVKVKGRKQPSGEKMQIGIESPAEFDSEEMFLRKIISIDSGAVTTSGNFHKYYESKGRIITHLIDPRSGRSVSNELISVTIYAPDAITADGYDHALMAMGLKDGLSFAENHKQLEAYFIYTKPDGTISDTATKGFYPFLH